MIEQLETRRLMATTLGRTGILRITGTDGDDEIGVSSRFVNEVQPNGNLILMQRLTFTVNGVDELVVNKVKIKRAVVELGAGNDLLIVGLNKKIDFTVNGGDGNDSISTSNGNDLLDGGAGDDYLASFSGRDTLISTEGSDTLFGGDSIDTADFSNRVDGITITLDNLENDGDTDLVETGNVGMDIETVLGGAGPDFISSAGNLALFPVSIFGGGGNDTLFGSAGNDTLQGARGKDSILGSSGDDILIGDSGRDYLLGGDGIDRLFGGGSDPSYFDSDGLWPPLGTQFDPILPIVEDRNPLPSVDNYRDTLEGQGGLDIAFYDYFDIRRNV